MKKLIGGMLAIFIGIGITFASYTPTKQDNKIIKTTQEKITSLTKTTQDTRNFFYQFKLLKEKFSNNKQLKYILTELTQKNYDIFKEKKEKAKILAKKNKKKIIDQYLNKVVDDKGILSQCTKYYELVDDVCFAHDFPTAVAIATWYRESTCRFKLPANGDGPFQIVSKNYGTGTMDEDLFIETLTDFIDFSKNKFKRYESKIKNNLNYQNIDLESFMNFAALYNGGKLLNGIIAPYNPKYIFDKYKGKFSEAKKFGTRAYTLKILEREYLNK